MTGFVTAQEARLLAVARSALGISCSADWWRLLVTSISPPARLGPTARGVLQDTLARGSVLALARGGGWAQRHGGRLWERTEALPRFEFTGNIIRLLQWVLKTPLAERDVAPLVLEHALTPAEEMFAVLLLQQMKGHAGELSLAEQAPMRASPLVVLAHAGSLAKANALPQKVPVLRLEDHAVYVIGLRDVLAKAWAADEASKREIDRPDRLSCLGEAQQAVLASFLELISTSLKSRALAGFLVDAAGRWLSTPRTAASYTASLSTTASLRERMEARKAAAALLHATQRLQTWDAEHRSMHFLDDDFELGQALIREWSGFGDAGFRAAALLISELEALPT